MIKRLQQARDEGFGIVEALVAILLFGILAVALVPPIIAALKLSADSTTVASAAQVAQGRVEDARSAAGTCADFVAFLAQPIPSDLTDSRGARYSMTQSAVTSDGTDAVSDPGWCVDSAVTAVTYTVAVTSVDTEVADVADVATVIAVPGLQ
ncbi:type IV pilus modification PilV family protein [Demequina sediminicola]|uniref:type IV pilus modification PilV family protein n=1 Tax=Demequina sediminicola TaxID=1095026 RepID=UPI00078293AA|nr:type II secretion system protein [Demequina sediminicola]